MTSLWRARTLGLLLALLMGISALPAAAVTIIRDAELEKSLRELAGPLMAAAGLNPSRINIWVISDSKMNAFVADNQTMVLHSGLLLTLKTPEQVQAVIAHEIAHIANGHIARRLANFKASNRLARLGLIFAAAAGAASGNPGAGLAVGAGAAELARRGFLSHTRAEEAAADQSSARYMANAGISPSAMVEVLDIFRGQESLSTNRQDPYVRTHPLTRDRLRAAKGFAAAYQINEIARQADDYWFARLQGKLSAFLRNPNWTLRRVKASDTSEIATMRRAIAYHEKPDPQRAAREVATLVQMRPNDPYYQELQGQIAFETRRYGDAVRAYERAMSLAPREALIQAHLGRALLAQKTPASDRRALSILQKAYSSDPGNPTMLRDLAQAYARAGQNGMASITTAERYALSGRIRDAGLHARRAVGLLPQGSPGYARAHDLMRTAERAAQR